MPELANRMQIEAEFATKLSRLTSKHRKELTALLGNPPDLNNVPPDFWQRIEKEKKQQMATALLLIYMASADQHTALWLPSDLRATAVEATQDKAADWSSGRASDLASQYVANSQKKLADAIARWNGQTAGTGLPGPDVFGRTMFDIKARGSGAVEVPQQTIDDTLLQIFGPARDAGIAATETTRSATAGFHGARGEAESLGVSLQVIWYTERDGRVCPFCKPLHGQRMKHWEGVMAAADLPPGVIDEVLRNGGPPAHPHCRCWVETVKGTA